SEREYFATTAPRLAYILTAPSPSRLRKASRTGVRLMPSASATASVGILAPALSSPDNMPLRTYWYACSTGARDLSIMLGDKEADSMCIVCPLRARTYVRSESYVVVAGKHCWISE